MWYKETALFFLLAIAAKFCSDPGIPTNGKRNLSPGSNGKYRVGQRILLTCQPGYINLGSNYRVCLSTGKWSGIDTKCTALLIFVTMPTNKTAKEGEMVVLRCSVENVNGVKSKTTWYKNGIKVITPAPDGRYFQLRFNGYFLIVKTIVADTGTYTCAAANDAGEVQASMFLEVKERKQLYSGCGISNYKKSTKIVGGGRAKPGQIPWQVLLWDKRGKKPFCGGVLLNERWVLTAASCFHSNDSHYLSNVRIILGEHNWQRKERKEQYFAIEKIQEHPQYNRSTFDSDITLVKLKRNVLMNDFVKPVCLPFSKSDEKLLKPGNVGLVSGWGYKDALLKNILKTLHQDSPPVVSDDVCKKAYSHYVVTPNMFCAGQFILCTGHAGSPLTMLNPVTGRAVLVGTVSWGSPKCAKASYEVYIKIQNYLDWIEKTAKN